MEKKLYYGAAYYPELWSKEVMAEDIKAMKEVGINVVRMAEFAWASMEPEEGNIDVGFFRECIETLYENGIDTVLCTPTPTPPIWMSHDHPERMHVNEAGEVMIHGARQHVCTNHSFMREKCRNIVEVMARELGSLPGVIAWQTDNEFKCHVGECFCQTCKVQWHAWLEKRYGTVEQLNDAWGTQIWSQRYLRFDQVPQPYKTTFLHNASLSTMYRIFSREKIVEFQKEQTDIIRNYSKAPITHNTNLWFRLDQEKLFSDLDFFSFDTYEPHDHYHNMLMMYDLGRGAKPGRDFWVMETSPSHNGCLTNAVPAHPDGFLTAESVAAYAMGARGFSYWLWRQQRTGCELPHGAILSAWGEPTAGYINVRNASEAHREIEEILCSTKPALALAALTYSDTASVFFQTEPLENLVYKHLFDEYYKRVSDAGIYRDVIFENAPVEGYRLVCSPFMPSLTDEYLQKMERFVESGGVWIVGPITGGRTTEHTVHTDCALGKLDELAGVKTLYTFSLSGTDTEGEAFGLKAPLGLWSTLLECRQAVPKGVIRGKNRDGAVFLTERTLGKGKIVLVGSWPMERPGHAMMSQILRQYAESLGIPLMADCTPGTITACRTDLEQDPGNEYLIAVNMNGLGGRVILEQGGFDRIKQHHLSAGSHDVQPYGYRIIQIKK
jgi:beta-galactosidase